jgi:multidrug resistance efflux pump
MRLFSLLCLPLACAVHAQDFSGEIMSKRSQVITVPESDVQPVVLRYLRSEGEKVNVGEAVLRTDSSRDEEALDDARNAQRSLALDQKGLLLSQSLLSIDDRSTELDKEESYKIALVDSSIAARFIARIEFDRNQRDAEVARLALAYASKVALSSVEKEKLIREKQALEMERLTVRISYLEGKAASTTVRASNKGYVLHRADGMPGHSGKFEQGSAGYSGMPVADVTGDVTELAVRFYVFQPDSTGLNVGQVIHVRPDGLPSLVFDAKVSALAGRAVSRPGRGDGRFIEVTADPVGRTPPRLRIGMSVLGSTESIAPVADDDLRVEARRSIPLDGIATASSKHIIAAPEIPNIPQLTVAYLAPNGSALKKGDRIAVFDTSPLEPLITQLDRDELAAEDKVATAKRDGESAIRDAAQEVEEAEAELDKSTRKAKLPANLITGIVARKAIIARDYSAMKLDAKRRKLDLTRRLSDLQITTAASAVDNIIARRNRLKAEVADSTIRADGDVVFIQADTADTRALAAGSQVWPGQAIGSSVARAKLLIQSFLPETEMFRLTDKTTFRVRVGSGPYSSVRVAAVGQAVHERSSSDKRKGLDILLDPNGGALATGGLILNQSVSVLMTP